MSTSWPQLSNFRSPISEGLGHVCASDALIPGEVGNRPGNLPDAMKAASGQTEPRHRLAKHGVAALVGSAVILHTASVEPGIRTSLPGELDIAGCRDTAADGRAALTIGPGRELVLGEGTHLELQIDTIEQRT
jgi:hypothetical protein